MAPTTIPKAAQLVPIMIVALLPRVAHQPIGLFERKRLAPAKDPHTAFFLQIHECHFSLVIYHYQTPTVRNAAHRTSVVLMITLGSLCIIQPDGDESMPDTSYELQGVRIFECAVDGELLRNNRSLNDLISAAWEQHARMIVVPVERLGDDFFRLRTGIAGEIVQKIVQYHLRLAIIGDISRYVEESTALRDFVYESNRGNQIWFVPSLEELEARLKAAPPRKN